MGQIFFLVSVSSGITLKLQKLCGFATPYYDKDVLERDMPFSYSAQYVGELIANQFVVTPN